MTDLTPAMHEAWQELSLSAVEPNPFFEPRAVLPASTLLTGGGAAALLVVEEGDQLQFAMPVVRRRGPRRVPLPALGSWQHRYCYLGTPLVRQSALRSAWEEVLDLVRYGRPEGEPWLILDRLALYGPVAVALQDALLDRNERVVTADVFGRPVLRRRAASTYLNDRISARHLKSLRRQRRRLADALGGDVAVVDEGQNPERLVAAVEGMLTMEGAGWKGRAGTALACRPRDAEYFRQFCAGFAASGRLQLWRLGVEERSAACQTNVVAGGAVFHVKVAYDERLARCSPGLQLELAMVDAFHGDDALSWVDSCVDPDNRVSAQLYPDREVLGGVFVPVGRRGEVAVRAARIATALRDGAGQARTHMARRRSKRPALEPAS